MENNMDMDAPSLEEFAGGIFENKEDVVENIKSAAEKIGIAPELIDNIDKDEPKKVYYAHKGCSWCCGRGMLDFARNGVFISSRKKEPSKAFLMSVKNTRRKLSRSIQRISLLTSGAARPGRNTCLSEDWKDGEWYKQNMTKVLCKCVKVVEEE